MVEGRSLLRHRRGGRRWVWWSKTMVGGCRTGCGDGSRLCCRRRRRTRWVVTGRGCPTAMRWTRSCWCCGRGCSGMRSTRRGSVRVPRRTGVFRSDDDLLLWFAAAGHPLPALVEALLTAPGALDDDGVLAAGELVPTFVIDPCRRCSPEECSLGTSPTKAINSAAFRKRLKSPISVTRASAVSVSTPRRQRSLPTSTRHGCWSAVSRIARSSASIRASTRSSVCR